MGERVLEIRTYRIRDGKRDEFGRRVSAVLPLLQRYGIDVVGHGPSIEDAEHYVLPACDRALRRTPPAAKWE